MLIKLAFVQFLAWHPPLSSSFSLGPRGVLRIRTRLRCSLSAISTMYEAFSHPRNCDEARDAASEHPDETQ